MTKEYQPLHHKYRPQRLDQLIGQEAIASTLKQALTSNRIAPAYIFTGPRGTGKTSSARILAKSLNCLNSEFPTTDPCGVCELCQSITTGTALDIIEIDAASNTGVDNIREIIERSRFAPVQARWKVYVIDECHMLSTAAFNALLKTLEEPPPQIVFILATTDPQRVLPTILSRCMRFDFRRIALDQIKNHLTVIARKEKIEIDDDAILLIARRSQGGLRDAESMLDQLSLLPPPIKTSAVWNLLGAVPEEELLNLVKSITDKDPKSILEICRELLDQGKEPIAILQGLASTLRDLVIKKAAPNYPNLCNISPENNKNLTTLANKIDLELLLNLQAKLKGSESQLRHSMQPRLWLEVLLLGLLASPDNTSKSITKVGEVKEKLTLKKEIQEGEARKENLLTQEHFIDKKEYNNDQAKNLNEAWVQILAMLELPSTKMLLSQQAHLTKITKDSIEIEVTAKWISMIESRRKIIEEAVEKSLKSSKKIIFKSQAENQNITNNKMDLIPKKELEVKNNQSIEKADGESNHNSGNTQEVISKSNLDTQVEQLANFFNGKIISLD